MDGYDMLNLRHEPSWAKWRKDLLRNNPPPFLGPLVTIKEAAEALDRSESYVRARIDDGRLNTWKDPVSKRVWILKDDLDILIGDNKALEDKAASRPKRPKNPNPQSEIHNPQSEDLDAIGGWEHPKPPPVIGGAAIEESALESQARYDRKQRENEEWYAAELAKLENRDPEEAVRQLQTERGWITPEPVGEPTLTDLLPRLAVAKKQRKQPARPVSWSSPNPRPRTPPEPYIDPDAQSAILNPKSEIERPFPIGWIRAPEVCNILDCSPATLVHLVQTGKLQRRRVPNPPTKPVYLYDSVEVERVAEQRLDRVTRPHPQKSLTWWGSRSAGRQLQEFDWWITTKQAAEMLGVSTARVCQMCERGLLPCHQKEPGKMRSPIRLSHLGVTLLAKRNTYQQHRARWERFKNQSAGFVPASEEYGIDEFDPRQRTGAALTDHGDYYSTRQASIELGVSIHSVHMLRRRGRLQGHKLKPHAGRSTAHQHWFFLKEDIHNLQADHEYNTHSRQGKRAQLPPSLRDPETQ